MASSSLASDDRFLQDKGEEERELIMMRLGLKVGERSIKMDLLRNISSESATGKPQKPPEPLLGSVKGKQRRL
jgi:hypothetical protein